MQQLIMLSPQVDAGAEVGAGCCKLCRQDWGRADCYAGDRSQPLRRAGPLQQRRQDGADCPCRPGCGWNGERKMHDAEGQAQSKHECRVGCCAGGWVNGPLTLLDSASAAAVICTGLPTACS